MHLASFYQSFHLLSLSTFAYNPFICLLFHNSKAAPSTTCLYQQSLRVSSHAISNENLLLLIRQLLHRQLLTSCSYPRQLNISFQGHGVTLTSPLGPSGWWNDWRLSVIINASSETGKNTRSMGKVGALMRYKGLLAFECFASALSLSGSKIYACIYTLRQALILLHPLFIYLRSTDSRANENTMECNTKSIPQVSRCPTCLLITLRDTSQEAISKPFDESSHSHPDPVESELVLYSRPFETERERHSTVSYEAALDFFP